MNKDNKIFLSYNQQMKKLRDDKKIDCNGTKDKIKLVRFGYFNIINGYKAPFVSGYNSEKNHKYLAGTDIDQMYYLKSFDDELRLFLLKYITQVEEEVRTLTAYKFDEINDNGQIPWFETDAYSSNSSLQDKMNTISSAYSELSRSHLDYVKFYMDKHEQIPTWIMIKVINFSTFIDVLKNSKKRVLHSICTLYSMFDKNNKPNVKLLIGSLHWLRKIRNSCAHNERIYDIQFKNNSISKRHSSDGRILDPYYDFLPSSYKRFKNKNIFDILIYFKYFLTKDEYNCMINNLKTMLINLKDKLLPGAFNYVRGNMGIRDISILDVLIKLPKNHIEYNKFDKY